MHFAFVSAIWQYSTVEASQHSLVTVMQAGRGVATDNGIRIFSVLRLCNHSFLSGKVLKTKSNVFMLIPVDESSAR
jgi:hypothetical protein